MRVMFRADAGPSIGAGHVRRCLSLAEELASRGWHIHLVTSRKTPATVPLPESLETTLLDEDSWADPSLLHGLGAADVIVLDHYGLGLEYEMALPPARLVVLEDLPNRRHRCDLLLAPSASHVAPYLSLLEPGCLVLHGARYSLLRPSFRKLRQARQPSAGRPCQRVLISCGATDPTDLTSLFLQALPDRPLEVTVALSSAAPHLGGLRTALSRWSGESRVELRTDVTEMAELMAASDLFLGAAGSSCWEACCLGLPMLVVEAVANQAQVMEQLLAADAALGLPANASNGEIARTLAQLLGEAELRQALSERAAELVDGDGCSRVAEAIEGLARGS